MLSKIQRWGNSQGIRIPKKLLNESHLHVGEEVEITLFEGKIIIEPSGKVHGRFDINFLANKMPNDYKVQEENWGAPVGKEF
ncbi:MAG: AbrB/MazE/SpoVT family DNA-binding domain-containing protein [Pseudomonadota bacterium]